jgi:RNA polymerase sigma factor (sigma-70 family)
MHMADRHLQAVLTYIHRQANARAVSALADGVLLDHFVSNGDQGAFTALVDRHGPMVLGVCRRVLRRAHDAEDAFQAAFLVLARKVPSIRKRNALASWLHGVAYHVAANLRRAESRRGVVQALRPDFIQADVVEEVSWREVRAAIDEELALLPQRYRAPLVLCYLEGKTRDEAALSLGWSEATFRGRLERGRDALRARPIRRGIGLSAVLLASALGQEAATAAPVALAAATVAAAMRFAAKGVTAGLISAQVASLTQRVLKAMFISKLKTAAVVLLAVGMAAVGGVMLARGPEDKSSDKTAKPPAHAEFEKPAPPAVPATAATMRVVVLDPQGKPLPGANVHSGIWTEEKSFKGNHDYTTDAAGVAQVELPKRFTIVRLWASAEPLVEMVAGWEQEELRSRKALPTDYTFRLESGLTAGGRLVDQGVSRLPASRFKSV